MGLGRVVGGGLVEAGVTVVTAFQVLWGTTLLPSSPGCWMAANRVLSSGVKNGPVISAPSGAEQIALRWPRSGPAVGTP